MAVDHAQAWQSWGETSFGDGIVVHVSRFRGARVIAESKRKVHTKGMVTLSRHDACF